MVGTVYMVAEKPSLASSIASILMPKFYFRFKLMNLVDSQVDKNSNIQILDEQFERI